MPLATSNGGMLDDVQKEIPQILGPGLAIQLSTEEHRGRVDVVVDHPSEDEPTLLRQLLIRSEDCAEQPKQVVAPGLMNLLTINPLDDAAPSLVTRIGINVSESKCQSFLL